MADYATLPDLVNLGIAGQAIATITNQARLAAIAAASRLADSYLAARFTLPLIAWQQDLTRAVVAIATYDLMSQRGFSPAPGSDENIRLRYEDAIRWLEKIAAGLVTPQVTDSSSGATPGLSSTGGGDVETSTSRGYTDRDSNRIPFGGD